MPGIFRLSIDNLIMDIAQIKGLHAVLLFGVSDKKDEIGSQSYDRQGVVQKAIREIKKEFKNLIVITDVCLCGYTSHGHCGVLKYSPQSIVHSLRKNHRPWTIDHGRTLKALARMALSHAEAGADWVAPSAMAKNQVAAIRTTLDKNGLKNIKIMGYSAKFASNFYGPFREAADSGPRFGDRRSYQLDYKDSKAALKEIADDIKEGADIVMVKPALSYLDVIAKAAEKFNSPLAAYNVSGEYAMVKIGAQKGFWDEKKMVFEIITSIKRAGADFIITYHTKDIARWLR